MSNSTNSKHQELLNTQTLSEETHKENSTLTEREKIENTPFYLIKQNDLWFIAMGNNMITEPVESKTIALDKLKTEKWDIIFHMCAIISDKMREYKEQK